MKSCLLFFTRRDGVEWAGIPPSLNPDWIGLTLEHADLENRSEYQIRFLFFFFGDEREPKRTKNLLLGSNCTNRLRTFSFYL